MNEIYSKNDKKGNYILLTLVNTRFNTIYSIQSFIFLLKVTKIKLRKFNKNKARRSKKSLKFRLKN